MLRLGLLLTPLIFCLCFALFVPFFSPYDANSTDLSAVRLAPSWAHFLGTDTLGRDLFTRIAYALRTSFIVGFGASFLAIIFALFYVFLARFFLYSVFMRALDAFLAFPALLLAMFFQSFLGGSLGVMVLVIAATHWCVVAKIFDSEIIKFQKLDFYLCAIVLGSTQFKAMLNEILPASLNLLIILFVLNVAHAIGNEATLSYFNLGVALGEPSLGVLLSDASKAIFIGAWWMIVFPLLALLMLILPLLALANALQDRLGVKI